MGVQGLWQLLHSAGKPVSPASLEGKVLAVDVSIWLHQTMKGMRDKDGNPLPNAHLQGLFSRICKLLFYRIRPVFVFDGGVPVLKKQTLAARRERKEAVDKQKGRTTEKLLQNLLQLHAVKGALGKKFEGEIPRRPPEQDLFQLPPLPEKDRGSADPLESAAAWEAELEEEDEHSSRFQMEVYQNLADVDFSSAEFASLPAELRHELLTDMKEQRKEDALARFIDMPKDAEDFSSFQLKNLIKQSKLTREIESVRKEMNTKTSGDIAYALGDDYYGKVVEARRVVSEDAAHYILIKGLTKQQQLQEAVKCVAKSGTDQESDKSERQEDITKKAAASRKRVKFIVKEDEFEACEEKNIAEALSEGSAETSESRKSKRGLSSSDVEFSLPRRTNKGKGRKIRGKRLLKGKGKSHCLKNIISDDSESDADPVENNQSPWSPPLSVSAAHEDTELASLTSASLKEMRDIGAMAYHDRPLSGNNSLASSACGHREDLAEIGIGAQTDGKELEDERQRLICEEEQLARIKEEKMAALMQSLERRSILSKTADEEQSSSLVSGYNSAERGGNMQELEVCSLKLNESKRTSLVSSTVDNAADKDVTGSLLETTVIVSQPKASPSSITAKSTSDSEEILEDVALPGQKAVKRNAKSEVFEQINDSDAKSAARKMPSLTVAYLEDLEPVETNSFVNGEHTRGIVCSNSDKPPAGDVCLEGKDMDNETVELSASSVAGVNVEQRDQAVARKNETHGDEHNVCKKVKIGETRNFESRHKGGDSEDEGFIEITFDPSLAKEDDLFPTNVFATSLLEADTPAIRKNARAADEENDGVRVIAQAVLRGDENDSKTIGKSAEDVKDSRDQGLYAKTETSVTMATDDTEEVEVSKQENVKDISQMELQEEDREITDPAFRGVETVRDLYDLHKELSSERRSLTYERGKQTRLTTSISDQINQEAQGLLQLFGVPFVVSPMEAEAQCAYLELAGLTEGTITDDSDVWLFGAKKVYKNFFNQTRYVECYSADAVKQKFGLDREKLINIALLCGSDYTEGIPGVGPVRAMEIMAEFPGDGLQGLRDFRKWWEMSKKSGLQRGPSKAESKLCNLKLHEGFPCQQVLDAYLKPTVDESEDSFSWGEPDIDLLRQFAKQKFGWNQQKSDDVLLPMMKECTKKMTQGRISSYFHPENLMKPAAVGSRRLQNALDKFLRKERSSSESETGSESSTDNADHPCKPHASSFPEPGESVIEKANKILQRNSVCRGKSRSKANEGNARTKKGRSDCNPWRRGAGGGQKVLTQGRVMLKDEVSLSESSSNEEENTSKKPAKRKNPKSDTQVSVAKTIKMGILGGQTRTRGTPSTKTVASTATAGGATRRRKNLPKKAVSLAELQAALGPDLNPARMTMDDLGSDFSEEDFQ